MKSFDEKLYICETCHKHLNKNEIRSQEVCNNMAVDPKPNDLNDLNNLEKILISKRTLFKKKQKKIVKKKNSMEKVNLLKLREAFVMFQ